MVKKRVFIPQKVGDKYVTQKAREYTLPDRWLVARKRELVAHGFRKDEISRREDEFEIGLLSMSLSPPERGKEAILQIVMRNRRNLVRRFMRMYGLSWDEAIDLVIERQEEANMDYGDTEQYLEYYYREKIIR